MNIGYWEAMRQEKFDCLVFHDVDLLPHNDRNIYTCPDNGVRHMSAYIDKFKYRYVRLVFDKLHSLLWCLNLRYILRVCIVLHLILDLAITNTWVWQQKARHIMSLLVLKPTLWSLLAQAFCTTIPSHDSPPGATIYHHRYKETWFGIVLWWDYVGCCKIIWAVPEFLLSLLR